MKTFFLSTFLLLIGTCIAQPTWYEIPSNTETKLNTINFPSPQVGYIGGNDSLLLKTINGGKSWQKLAPKGITFTHIYKDIVHLNFVNDSIGFLMFETRSPVAEIYKTTDGGLNWSVYTTSGVCLPKISYFFDEDNAVVAGAGCFQGEFVDQLVDGKWKGPQSIGKAFVGGELRAIDFLNEDFGMVGGTSRYIFRTTDGGNNWDSIQWAWAPVDTVTITDIIIVDDTLAYATYDEKGSTGVVETRDGGLSWKDAWKLFSFFSPGFNAIEATGTGQIFIGGQGQSSLGKGLMQSQSGKFWRFQLVDHELFDIATYNDSVVFAVGDSGYIITNRNPILLSTPELTSEATLQVYPNPSSDRIQVQHATKGPFTVNVVDLNGRTIIEERREGSNQFSLDVSYLIPGMYLLQLTTNSGIYTEKILKTDHY